ncbi:hypothetical protein [Agrococcus sp. Marseille-Q4369]|uniref:hypothetical protein n=1 Tax=Agrococcus sp. Marseille-Q4369 TaxID=2810513 RepID=UPI001B8AAC8A|nr:hypothetical protein [Agrococcus sp. Marseille-Q4369]QUW19320.1 hypothetical protein JSQ78_02990 [Agrococcus sp. Marseille-Q4369]
MSSRVIERAERQTTWSSAEVWHAWPLAWADRTSRSLLLVALAVAGLLSCYGLTLLLHHPPELAPSLTLRGIGVLLLVLATLVAPASRSYRLGALYCVVLFACTQAAVLLLQSTSLIGASTYGALDAIHFAAFGTLVVAWMLVRMRHPVTILVVVTGFAMAGAAFSARALPAIRERLFEHPWQEAGSSIDEAVGRIGAVLLVLSLVLLAWWLDGWMRALLPVANVAEPHGSGRAHRTGEGPRVRVAVVSMLCCLDLLALAVAISAKQPTSRGRLSEADDWWCSVVIAVSTARASLVIMAIAAAVIWLGDPVQRPV